MERSDCSPSRRSVRTNAAVMDARSASREVAMTRKMMVAAALAAALCAGLAASDAFARGGGGGHVGGGFGGAHAGGGFGTTHGVGGFSGARPGRGFSGTGMRGSRGTAAINPGLLMLQRPQTPPPAILNPGVAPSAPGPSAIPANHGSSAGLGSSTNPGEANGMSSSIAPGARASRHRTSEDQSQAVSAMDRQLDRALTICRGC
jgi:hypothetical protein